MDIDIRYMRRALQLAALGAGTTGSNPMVGAVIVAPDGRIIGEGWHRRYGQGHAEVNAVASVAPADEALLSRSTMYVTLEPCSHYGKTPPCAALLIEKRIPRVVVAATDPFEKVSGRGIAMLRAAGCEVTTGVLAEESERLNVKFFTAHRCRRPFVLLKWAQTADGCIGVPGKRLQISTPLSAQAVHRLRSRYGAILVGSGTVIADNPLLDTRLWPMGDTPRRITVDRRGRISADHRFFRTEGLAEALYFTCGTPRPDLPSALMQLPLTPGEDEITTLLAELYGRGITSLMVEGGATMLSVFLRSGLWDAARVETNINMRVGSPSARVAGHPAGALAGVTCIDGNVIEIYANNPLVDVKNL